MSEKEQMINDFIKRIKPNEVDRILNELYRLDATSLSQAALETPQLPPRPYPS